MIKRKNLFRKVLIMVMVLLTITINTANVYAADNLYEAAISEDFLIKIKNPYGKERTIVFEIEYYGEENQPIYSKRIEDNFQSKEEKTFDAKVYFNSKNTSKIEVKFVDKNEEQTVNIVTIVLLPIVIIYFILILIVL